MPKEPDGDTVRFMRQVVSYSRCTSMKRTEYDKLCEPSLAWECIACLHPGFDTPARKSHETTNTGGKEGNPRVRMNRDLHANLKKRGMKFAHVNISTLPGYYACLLYTSPSPRDA